MNHLIALLSSVTCLTLMAMVYYCKFLTGQRSWLRSDVIQMNLLAILTGLFSLALPATIMGLLGVTATGFSFATLGNSAIEIASAAAITATVWLYVSAVKRGNSEARFSDNVMPFTPTPPAPRTPTRPMKKAA
ncbi:hypothetical protein [Donghicola tyrosinivorans]|uniref:MotA/TolQ/ExbB proton channel family protein n=1 Tax=Donghicola tyrosinivorans TaxID=1652492 RepID=A0A2T0X5G0_9RHOB|nr:hypothetical protein [Donghicola tyrosinivorans]PRY94179.1 hypothetical protein CLV74_101315 [Donghicola tyrosinivorans]